MFPVDVFWFSKIFYEALRTIHRYVRNKVFGMELARSGCCCTACCTVILTTVQLPLSWW